MHPPKWNLIADIAQFILDIAIAIITLTDTQGKKPQPTRWNKKATLPKPSSNKKFR